MVYGIWYMVYGSSMWYTTRIGTVPVVSLHCRWLLEKGARGKGGGRGRRKMKGRVES